MWHCDNLGGLGEHVVCHLLGFLVYILKLFFALFFGLSEACTSGPI